MKALLFSDSKDVFEKTEKIAEGWFELIWYNYNDLQKEKYPSVDIVIAHFNKKRIVEGTFMPIMKIRGRIGECIPILAIINGTSQEIFSTLKAGAYDYITDVEDMQKYKGKIESVFLWNWYQKKHKNCK